MIPILNPQGLRLVENKFQEFCDKYQKNKQIMTWERVLMSLFYSQEVQQIKGYLGQHKHVPSDKRKEITEALKTHHLQINKQAVVSYVEQKGKSSFADILKTQKEVVSAYYTGKLSACVEQTLFEKH